MPYSVMEVQQGTAASFIVKEPNIHFHEMDT